MYYNWWLLDVGKDHESVATDRDDQQDEEDKGDDGADEPEGHIYMKKINNNSEKITFKATHTTLIPNSINDIYTAIFTIDSDDNEICLSYHQQYRKKAKL